MNDKDRETVSLDQIESELHPFTHISVNNALLKFLQLTRQSQISKKQSDRFLSFIESALPFPNEMPKDMKSLLQKLNVIDYFKKRAVCGRKLPKNQNLCAQCIQTETKHNAYIQDTDVYAPLSNIISKLSVQIKAYRNIIRNPDLQITYDLSFGRAYQYLLQKYPNENLLTSLLHVDGISLVKSTKLKL